MDGSTPLTATVSLDSVPTSFVLNNHYSYSNNKLEINKIPQGFQGGEFTFGYTIPKKNAKITKKFTLRALNEEYAIHLKVNPSVINAKTAGTVTVTAEDSKGTVYTQNTGSGNDEVALYVNNKKVSSGTSGWAVSYSAGQTAAINIELRKGTTVCDNEVIEFVEDGAQGVGGLSIMLSNITDQIPCDSKGIASAHTISIPFSAYKRITRVNCNAALPTSFPSGMSGKIVRNSTASDD
jgi:hypothetical protein